MKIKLIQPRMSLRAVDSAYKRVMAPSLALMTIAALTPEGYEVTIEDENVERLKYDFSVDLAGITVNVDTSKRACEIASIYRKMGIKVVAGGIHASASPEDIMDYFDAVCIGEAEGVWNEILEDFKNGNLKKIYRSAGNSLAGKTPVPMRRLIKSGRYLYTNTVCTGRGCPYSCEFCYNSCDYIIHKTRNRPVENVVNEILGLDTRHVMFIDDNFIGNPLWTEDFLNRIKPLGLIWNAAVSSNIGEKPEMLDLMKESGCKSLFIGFESVNPKSIYSVRKQQNDPLRYKKLIGEIHKRGIMVNASMVFGFDHDEPGVFNATLDWLVENKIETMTAHILTPYPGTILYKKLLQEQRIIDFDLEHYNTSHVVFKPKLMTAEELLAGYLWIYKELYKFNNIMKRIPDCPEQKMPYLLFNLLYRKFGRLTSFFARMGMMNKAGKFARKLSYNV